MIIELCESFWLAIYDLVCHDTESKFSIRRVVFNEDTIQPLGLNVPKEKTRVIFIYSHRHHE